MKGVYTIFKREFLGYFITPIAYVFIAIFLIASGAFTFYLGNFYERGQADLQPFFLWHPWLYLFLIPAISMRLWSEERRSGTIEILMTLPLPFWQLVVGKFLAAWAFTGIALLSTFTMWITVNYLGSPDNGVILANYIGSFLMAGGYIAIGASISSLTKNQVIAFVVSVVVCFIFTISGHSLVINFFQSWAPQFLIDLISSFSFLANYLEISKGILEFKSLIYFISLLAFWLVINTVILTVKRD